MIEISRQVFIDCAEDEGVSVLADYSGRGMYGKQCVAVTGRPEDLLKFLMRVIPAIEGATTDEASKTMWTFQDPEWMDMHDDDFGRDRVYYWPQVRAI